MSKKYIASSGYSYLGFSYDTPEQAHRAALGIDYWYNNMTGYSTAFNVEPLHESEVTEISTDPITPEQYLDLIKQKRAEEAELKQRIRQMKADLEAKYASAISAYINLNTPYNYLDTIQVVTRRKSGRKKVTEGQVCGVTIGPKAELRPELRRMDLPKDPIISIEVIERFDPTVVELRRVCKNCKHFTRHKNELLDINEGFCTLHNTAIHNDYRDAPTECNDPKPFGNIDDEYNDDF